MLIAIPLFAALNVARGRKLFGLTESTEAGRVVTTAGMAILTAFSAQNPAYVFLWTWIMLMLWCSFAWDKYWGACIGSNTDFTREACKPVDWIMERIGIPHDKLWGIVAMGLRQSFAIPAVVGVAFLSGHPINALLAPLTLYFGLLYYVAGLLYQPKAVMLGEALTGAALGFLLT